MSLIQQLENFAKIEIVQRIGARQIEAVRKRLTSKKRHAIRSEITAGIYDPPFKHYELHHVVPISLGGLNDDENIVLCHPLLHSCIHEFIVAQQEIGIGQWAHVKIPRLSGRIWSPDFRPL